MTKTILLFAVLSTSFYAFADRIGGSEFDTGTIIKLGNCENLATRKKVGIEIKISFFNVIKGDIRPATVLLKNNSMPAICSDLKKGQSVIVGHAQGNDTPPFTNGFTIIDSITITNS